MSTTIRVFLQRIEEDQRLPERVRSALRALANEGRLSDQAAVEQALGADAGEPNHAYVEDTTSEGAARAS